MSERRRSGAWFTRKPWKTQSCCVMTDGKTVEIEFYLKAWTSVSLDRSHARLLAKRINQCLDATVKK